MKKTIAIYLAIGLPLFGLVCILFYSISAGPDLTFILKHVGMFILIGGASLLFGALLGFLFGIPKSNDDDHDDDNPYKANTNLEQISDWLTKILLGAGLTQMSEIVSWIGRISEKMASKLTVVGNDEAVFISSLLVYFLVCGFLDGYLATRIILPRVFSKADNLEGANKDEPLTLL